MGRTRHGKKINCLLQAISLFPTVFSKDLSYRTNKNQGLFGKGINYGLTFTKQSLVLMTLSKVSFENIRRKSFHNVSYPISDKSGHLTLSQTSFCFFTCLQYKPFVKHCGKGDFARNEQFLLFSQCFLPIWITFCHFHQI